MKNKYIISILIILFFVIVTLSITDVTAGLFGPDTIDCEEFSVEIPEGWEIPSGYQEYHTDKVHSIAITTGLVETGEIYRNLDLSTVPLSDLPNTMYVVDKYTKGDLTVMKGEDTDENNTYGNITYAEFDKDGKHFYLAIYSPYDCSLDDINLRDDVKMINKLKDSLKVK